MNRLLMSLVLGTLLIAGCSSTEQLPSAVSTQVEHSGGQLVVANMVTFDEAAGVVQDHKDVINRLKLAGMNVSDTIHGAVDGSTPFGIGPSEITLTVDGEELKVYGFATVAEAEKAIRSFGTAPDNAAEFKKAVPAIWIHAGRTILGLPNGDDTLAAKIAQVFK